MNITVEKLENKCGGSLKLSLRRSYRLLGKPRSRYIAALGTIRIKHLSDAAHIENFLENLTQRLFGQGLSTGTIHNLLRSLCRRQPAFSHFFENLKF